MGFGVKGIFNSVANLTGKTSDNGKSGESSLYDFLNTMSKFGIQVQSNFEVEFLQIEGFQFFCQNVTIPGIKSQNAELFFHGRSVQVPVVAEQGHEFSWTVINDASGVIYTTLRDMMFEDYKYRMPDNMYTVRVKARSDGTNHAGMNIIMSGVRMTDIGQLDFGTTNNETQTFTVTGYVNFVDFEVGEIKKSGGLLGAVDKVSNKMSNILGK